MYTTFVSVVAPTTYFSSWLTLEYQINGGTSFCLKKLSKTDPRNVIWTPWLSICLICYLFHTYPFLENIPLLNDFLFEARSFSSKRYCLSVIVRVSLRKILHVNLLFPTQMDMRYENLSHRFTYSMLFYVFLYPGWWLTTSSKVDRTLFKQHYETVCTQMLKINEWNMDNDNF